MQHPGTCHDGGESGRLGDGYPANIQVVDERAHARKSRIVLQPEACDEHFEGHLGVNMRELRAIEVEAQCLLRAVLDSREPDKAGLRIDEPANEPG